MASDFQPLCRTMLPRHEAVDHGETIDAFAAPPEFGGDKAANEPAERPADQAVRTKRLHTPDLVCVVRRHCLERAIAPG